MPLADTIKPSDGTRKRTTESINSLSKKRSGRLREPSIENGSRGDDVSPSRLASSKKPLAKKTVSDNNSEKRAKTPIADKVPKKSVQRAKGSLALNKTIEAEDKKKRLFDVEEANVNSTTTIKDNIEGVKAKPDRSKPVKQPVKTPASERRVPSAKKKNWATVVKKKSGSTLKGEEEDQQQQQQQERQPVEMIPRETKSAEMQPEGAPFSSCSFFEKLQQGVKAYFSSRNSLTEEKPNKKKVTDGGIRTGAGVAKGGKEETKARTQEHKINNKIKNLDSDLFYDRPRLKSNSGGQTNNFLNKKPKVLHYVRRKKLYHPKKHYERIQIPRKGYFYRLFEFRPSQSATGPVSHRLEPISLPTKPEIQIARLASSSPKVSDIYKKRIKKSRKGTSDISHRNDELALVSNYLEAVNFILNQRMVAQKFEKEINRIALDWPIEPSAAPENISFLRDEKKSISSESLCFEEDKNLSAASENSLNNDLNVTNIQKLDHGLQIESRESYLALESQRRNSTLDCKLPEMSDRNSDRSFDTLMNCLKDSLGDEQRYGALEISPIMMTNGDLETSLIHETQPKLESNIASASAKDFDESLPNSLKEDDCMAISFSKYKNDQSLKMKSKEKFAELLLGDIDLHSELQNYLQETKIRKANDTEYIPPVINKSDQSFGLNAEQLPKQNFDSAVDMDADVVQVPFNPFSEINSPPEETIHLEAQDLRSNTETEVSKTQLEIDLKEPAQEDRGHMTSTNKKDNLVSDLVELLFKKHNEQLGGALDRYEKVSPMKAVSRAKKSKTKLLRNNLVQPLAKDELASNIGNTNSERNKFQRNEDTGAERKIKTEEDADVSQSPKSRKWCPTFDELTDIYSCIIKLNSKRKDFKKLENLRSSSIMSILRDKLHSKQSNADLINFTKTLKEYFKPPSGWKSGADANKHKKLQEYVNMFQEILMSSLSIEQITYLNTVISQVQEQETLTESCVKTNRKGSKKSISKDRTKSKIETSNPPVALSGGETKEQEPKLAKNTPTKTCSPKEPSTVQSKSNLKGKSDLKKIQSVVKSPQKVELSPPAELEKVLKSTFNSENLTKKAKAVGKILVNVKICGSRVLVNDFSYIHDEKSLYARPPVRNKVSELIIEKLTSDKSCKASLSDVSLALPTPKKSSKKLIKKPHNIKIVLKSTKSGSQKSGKKLKIRKDDPDKKSQNSEEVDVTKIKSLKPAEECKNVNPVETVFPNASVPFEGRKNAFEYDQERLKAQHPIDAIIETSESKIMESVESTENIDPNDKLSVETMSAKKLEATDLEEASNKTKAEMPFLNDLINDLGWSNEDNRKDLIRTRSYSINTNRDKSSILRESSTNEVKFLDDSQLKRGTAGNVGKKNRKIPMRQHNTYFCYPSVVRTDKSIEVKKKTSAEANSAVVKKVSSKTVKKTDSRVVKTANLKVMKEADLKMMKTNSKATKKSDPRGTKTMNLKIVKQTDLKMTKAMNAKPVQKKNFKESLKSSDAASTFSRQVATSERLAKKPDRLTKSNRISPKQKENFSQSAKSRSSIIPKTDSRKNSEQSILYMKGISDFGSEASSINASTASSYFEEVLLRQKPHSGNSAKSTSSSETAEIIEKYKTSPIVIFSTLDDSDGVTSQFAMIHSDSVLKTLSRSPISPTKIETVFKSHSDLKFYPGRISDSTEEQRPWVKFILTPQQEANADLPAHQIKVVDKRHQAQTDRTEEDEDSENTQIPLDSIEKFIDELRDSRLKASRQRELEKRKNEKRKVSSSAMIKQKVRWSHCDLSKNVDVKKQDCRKNKSKISFLEAKRRTEKKNLGKEAILAKVIVSILQFLLKQRVKEVENAEESDKYSESENLTSDLDDNVSDEEEAVEKWHRLEKTTNVMLNAVLNGVTKFEKLLKKKKLIAALKAELKKREANLGANVESLLQLSKKLASLKSLGKIESETPNDETEKEAEEQEVMTFPRPSEEIKLAESLSSKENEVENLGRKPSTYFDAEEKVKGENEGCPKELQSQTGETSADTMLTLLGESTTEIKRSEEAYPTLALTQSDQSLFSKKSIDSETEEIIFSKIHESLEENNVYYSMALFDSFLKKKGILDRDEKLQSLLQTVNQKTKALMRDLEKSAWIKLLFLLEEVSRIYDVEEEKSGTESMYRFITNQLNKPLTFIGRIQLINEKVINLQNFLSQSKTCLSDFYLHNVISRFLTRLLQMKNSVIPRLTSSVMRFFDDEVTGNIPGYKIRAVKAAHNFYSTSDSSEKKSQLQFLKSQIRDQRLFIEYLINADSGSSSSEISDVKNRVSEKLKSLEKSLLGMTKEEDEKNLSKESLLESAANSVSLSQISSFLSLTRTCRSIRIAKPNTWNVEACK